jgi:hypothetical protein
MTSALPIITSLNNQELRVALVGGIFTMTFQWNTQESDGAGAWYMDIREDDRAPVAIGLKLVLGVLGKRSPHAFFVNNILTVVDTSGDDRDPGFDDLGDGTTGAARVVIQHNTLDDIFGTG